jgi:hypothetical protein
MGRDRSMGRGDHVPTEPQQAAALRLLLRREDKKLDAVWESYRRPTVEKVRPNLDEDLRRPVFLGSAAARNHWAGYVDASWPEVVADLDRRALDWLVREIDATLHTRLIPAGATLETDPARVAAIEDKPGSMQIALGRWDDTATKGFEWMGKRIRSAEENRLFFEVIGHEGIYFELSNDDFRRTDPFMGEGDLGCHRRHQRHRVRQQLHRGTADRSGFARDDGT